MNRILINTFCALLLMAAAQAQNVGIGTNQPHASAALDVSSPNKGFLIPRIDVVANPVAAPATGLMIYNTNPGAFYGVGLYINMGTDIAPQWERVASSGSGNFIRNQTTTQPNSNFHISNDGAIDGKLAIGNSTALAFPLTVNSSNASYTGFVLSNSSSFGTWLFRVNGAGSHVPGSLMLVNFTTGRTAIISTGDKVGINMIGEPAATLDVGGDIRAQGDFLVGIQTIREEFTVDGNNWVLKTKSCPNGYQLLSGGGGHRDWNSAVKDIELAYNGPDPDAPTTKWRLMAHNTSSSSRALVIICNCAKIR